MSLQVFASTFASSTGMIRVLLRAIYNPIIVIIQLLLRGAVLNLNPKPRALGVSTKLSPAQGFAA